MASHPATAPHRNLDRLLAPISPENPVGESLRYEGAYDRIGAARREDDATLSQGVWKSALKRADWNEVERLCVELLQTRTKDLQIAAWLLEAWLHLDHFGGIRDGLELVRRLVDAYWPEIHPQMDDGDMEYRVAPINWINEKLSIQVKLIPITNPESDDAPPYCWADWENACRIEVPDPNLRPQASAQPRPPKLTLADFQRSLMFTPTGFFSRMGAEVEFAMEACAQLEGDLDRVCGKHGPSLRQFFGVLEAIHGFINSTLSQRQPEEEVSPMIGGTEHEPDELAMEGPIFGPGPISSRDEAYRRLAEAAEYLSRVEPHSPAPYLVKRAIQWGSLSLPELLPELIRNPSELTEVFRLLQMGDLKKSEK